jgi:hypothetical protein
MAQAVFPPTPNLGSVIEGEILLQRPEMKKMLNMDKAMADILSRTDLQPSERLREYMNIFSRFRSLRDDILINGTTQEAQKNYDDTTSTALETETLNATEEFVTPNNTASRVISNPGDFMFPNATEEFVTPNNTASDAISTPREFMFSNVALPPEDMDKDPQKRLAEEFLKALEASDDVNHTVSDYFYIPDLTDVSSSNSIPEKNITNSVKAILNFLLEGGTLNKNAIETFQDLKPLLKNAPQVYAAIDKKIQKTAKKVRKIFSPLVPKHLKHISVGQPQLILNKLQQGAGVHDFNIFNAWDIAFRPDLNKKHST